MVQIDNDLTPSDLAPKIARLWDHSAQNIRAIEAHQESISESLVVTVEGRYTAMRWTEWTQGFQYGSAFSCPTRVRFDTSFHANSILKRTSGSPRQCGCSRLSR